MLALAMELLLRFRNNGTIAGNKVKIQKFIILLLFFFLQLKH